MRGVRGFLKWHDVLVRTMSSIDSELTELMSGRCYLQGLALPILPVCSKVDFIERFNGCKRNDYC